MKKSLKTGKIQLPKLGLFLLLIVSIPNFSSAENIINETVITSKVSDTNDSLVVTNFINEKVRYFNADKLGQSYIVNDVEELIKYDANGVRLFTYFDRTFGEISYIDVTNPFQIAVFYEDFQTIVWLDRTLNPISSVNLSKFGFFQINVFSVSSDNHLWIYDNATFQIKKINSQGEVIVESLQLNNQIPNLNPISIVERNNRIYLNNPKTGILVFDNFGQFTQTLPILNLTDFQLINNQIFYQKDNKLHRFQLQTLQHTIVDLSFDILEDEQILVQKNHWFWIKESEVVIGDFGL